MKKLKFISLILAAGMIFSCAACDAEQEPGPAAEITALETPANVQISESGLITWDAVENATEYVVTVNGTEYTVSGNSYQVASLTDGFTYSVKARGENYKDSAASEEKTFEARELVTVAIQGKNVVHSEQTLQLIATVTGASDRSVTWSITQGAEYATVSPHGKVTAKKVSGDKIIKVTATSVQDPTVSATHTITIGAQPDLTQEMLDEVKNQTKLEFFGHVQIDLYTFTVTDRLVESHELPIDTKLDGTHWYSSYQDGNTGMENSLYYANHEGVASQVSVSFMNEEQYTPMLDSNGENVSWQASGLYNNFAEGLLVSDFEFDTDLWLWKYVGQDETLKDRMAASANPYDFKATDLALIIEDGAIYGIYSKAEDDYTLSAGHRAEQRLYAYFNYGDDIEVPTIGKYKHDAKYDKQYSAFQTAIDNMRALDSYSLDFIQDTRSVLAGGETVQGFEETVTLTDCYFKPFNCPNPTSSLETSERVYTGDDYGYHKFSDTVYNSYVTAVKEGEDGVQTKQFEAARAFEGDFAKAKPSFAFSPEIFTSFAEDEETGETMFFVDDAMTPVASTFYYGLGTEIELYGLFATRGTTSVGTFTPFVTVKDGYIIDAGFYFYIGYVYGIVQLEYSNFNTAALPEDVNVTFTQRVVPATYGDYDIVNTQTEEENIDCLEYMTTLFGDAATAEAVPFFGVNEVFGDSFATGFVSSRVVHDAATQTNMMKEPVLLWYDVPLDVDYTIESSIRKAAAYLRANGFVETRGVFVKGEISVEIVDNNLDLYIYIWKTGASNPAPQQA